MSSRLVGVTGEGSPTSLIYATSFFLFLILPFPDAYLLVISCSRLRITIIASPFRSPLISP